MLIIAYGMVYAKKFLNKFYVFFKKDISDKFWIPAQRNMEPEGILLIEGQ